MTLAQLDEMLAGIELELLASRQKPVVAWEPWKVVATTLVAASALIAGTIVILKAYGIIP